MSRELDGKSSSSIMKRSAKAKSERSMAPGSEDQSSNLVEGRNLVKRITRHNGGGSVEDAKPLEKVTVGKKGTAAALMGGKRAGSASSTETRLEMSKTIVQVTRRTALEKLTGSASSVQRKLPKAKRVSEESVTDLKTEGGSLKRRRTEDSVEEVQSEVDSVTEVQAVVRRSMVEEEVVESSEMDVREDEPAPLDDEKKKSVQETQQLLNLVSFKSPVAAPSAENSTSQKALSQQVDEHLENETVAQIQEDITAQGEELDVIVSENTGTTKEVAKEDKIKEVESCGKAKKLSDCAAKSEEYFPSIDAGSEVFSDGDDIENLLRIEQRCASVQSWVARHSLEEIEVEPNVEQMEVEDEVTVEGGGVLLVEACAAPKSEESSEKISDEDKKSCQTEDVAKSTPAAVAAADLCLVDEEKSASEERVNEEANVGMESVVEGSIVEGENLTISRSSNVDNDEGYCHQNSEDMVGLIKQESKNRLKDDFSSLEERSTSKELNGTENRGEVVEDALEEDTPSVLGTGSTASAVETGDKDTDRKSSTNENSSDVNVCQTVDLDSEESVGTVPCTVSTVTETPGTAETKSSVMQEVMQVDQGGSETTNTANSDSQVSARHDSAIAVSPTDGTSPASDAGEEDASCEVADKTAENSSVNLPAKSPLSAEKELEKSPETTDATDKSSSHDVQGNIVEAEEEVCSSETQPETGAPADDVEVAVTASSEDTSGKVGMSSAAVSVQSGTLPVIAISTTSGTPAVSVVVARTFTSTVAGSGGPAATSVVAAGAVPGFVGMPPVAIRAAVPGSAVGSVFVHVADPRQFAMHLQQQQQQQQGQVQGQQAQTPVFHIPTLSPQQGGGPPQLVMSPLSPQQVALLSSSMPATSQPPHQLMGGVPPRHVTLVTSGPRPQLLQQCLLTSAGPQPLTLLSAPQSTSNSTSGATSTAAQPSVPVQHLAILSHALQGAAAAGGTATSTAVPTSGHQQPVALIAAAGPNQTPVMRMAPAVLPRHPMSASSAMQHLTSAVQQTISLQQLQLSFAAAAAAAQQQQQLGSSSVRSPIPIQRLPVLCTAQPSASSSTASQSTTTSQAVVSVANAPVVSLPVSPMVSVAASALTAFLKKENIASQLLPPPATTIAKLSPHDVALKGTRFRILLRRNNF